MNAVKMQNITRHHTRQTCYKIEIDALIKQVLNWHRCEILILKYFCALLFNKLDTNITYFRGQYGFGRNTFPAKISK